MQTPRNTVLIFRRYLTLSLRNPVLALLGLTQPLLYFALFGPLLKGVVPLTGFPPGSTWQQILVPALLVQLGLLAGAFVGFAIIAELRNGVVERMRVTPASRLALLMGRVLRDVVTLVVQSLVLLAISVVFGLRAPLVGVLIAMGFIILLTVTMASLSYTAGLLAKSEDTLSSLLGTVILPALLLSGILLPMSLAPAWLNELSRANPLRYIVDAMRDAFLGNYATTSMWNGLAVAVTIAAIAVTIGTRTFRRETA